MWIAPGLVEIRIFLVTPAPTRVFRLWRSMWKIVNKESDKRGARGRTLLRVRPLGRSSPYS